MHMGIGYQIPPGQTVKHETPSRSGPNPTAPAAIPTGLRCSLLADGHGLRDLHLGAIQGALGAIKFSFFPRKASQLGAAQVVMPLLLKSRPGLLDACGGGRGGAFAGKP